MNDYAPQRACILDGLSCALCKEGDHRMSCIADKRCAPKRERRNWRPATERPGPPLDRGAYQSARFLRPSRERMFKSRSVGRAVPLPIAAARPRYGPDGRHQIDHRSAPQGILDEMRLGSQTQNNFASCSSRIGVVGVDNCAIGDASGKVSLIRRSEAQSVADLGAQAVGADQEIGVVAR